MIGTSYWRAFVTPRRAVELQRVLDQLPRDLDSHMTSFRRATPRGQVPRFPWVSSPIGAMQHQPFTVPELEAIPEIVRRFNTNPASVTQAELALLRRAASLHVGGAMEGGSPLVSWSRPPPRGQPDPVSFAGRRRFRVRAEFHPRDVLDNITPSEANTLTPGEEAAGFEPIANADEAEFLATAERDARVVTVEPLRPVRGELVRGSTQWMAQHARQLRWAGRGVLVISLGISTYRVLTARPGEGWRVFGQEAGAQALGWGGAVLAGAACVGFGIATGGVGLLLCGMAGGLLGGLAGSALGGRAVDALSQTGSEDDPFGLLAPGEAGPGPVPVGDGGRAVLVSPVTGEPLLVPLLPEPQLLDY